MLASALPPDIRLNSTPSPPRSKRLLSPDEFLDAVDEPPAPATEAEKQEREHEKNPSPAPEPSPEPTIPANPAHAYLAKLALISLVPGDRVAVNISKTVGAHNWRVSQILGPEEISEDKVPGLVENGKAMIALVESDDMGNEELGKRYRVPARQDTLVKIRPGQSLADVVPEDQLARPAPNQDLILPTTTFGRHSFKGFPQESATGVKRKYSEVGTSAAGRVVIKMESRDDYEDGLDEPDWKKVHVVTPQERTEESGNEAQERPTMELELPAMSVKQSQQDPRESMGQEQQAEAVEGRLEQRRESVPTTQQRVALPANDGRSPSVKERASSSRSPRVSVPPLPTQQQEEENALLAEDPDGLESLPLFELLAKLKDLKKIQRLAIKYKDENDKLSAKSKKSEEKSKELEEELESVKEENRELRKGIHAVTNAADTLKGIVLGNSAGGNSKSTKPSQKQRSERQTKSKSAGTSSNALDSSDSDSDASSLSSHTDSSASSDHDNEPSSSNQQPRKRRHRRTSGGVPHWQKPAPVAGALDLARAEIEKAWGNGQAAANRAKDLIAWKGDHPGLFYSVAQTFSRDG